MKQRMSSLLLWLLVFNVLALMIFGGRYLYSAMKEKQVQHKQALAAANIIVRMGGMNINDATHLMELSADLEHGAEMSDVDLDWCLDKLKSQKPSYSFALSRRQDVDAVLSEGLKGLNPSQKEELYQALVTQMAGDNQNEEVGIDIGGPAHILGKLGDKRAIPILQAHLNDPRPRVHHTVQKAIDRLEGKPVT